MRKKDKPFDSFVINMMDSGDMSVGIWPTQVTITVESNAQFTDQIKMKENRELFREACQKFAEWFFENGACSIVFEDECYDCGQSYEGDYRKHAEKCPFKLAMERE